MPRRRKRAGGVPPNYEALLKRLRRLYAKQQRSAEFEAERALLLRQVRGLQSQLATLYELEKPLAIGSTATVWLVRDLRLNQERALKLTRPRLGKLSNLVQVIRTEKEKLAALNHQNLLKVYFADELRFARYVFPYYVTDYLPGIRDLDDFILEHRHELEAVDIVTYFRDALVGLAYLHSKGIVHCDIKPANLLIARGSSTLVADLGYAKYLSLLPPPNDKVTDVVYTRAYAHPELREKVTRTTDPAANETTLPRKQLKVGFDLFAMGRTIQEILLRLRTASGGKGVPAPFDRYQYVFLLYVAKRLLDGQLDPERSTRDPLLSDVIPGIPETALRELRYTRADDAVADLEKLLKLYDLEGVIPELLANQSRYVRIPHSTVPLTDRVKRIIDYPTFRRLGRVTQLGFVSGVYPGATHTRAEHVLGTFARCCEYVRALWYDPKNPLFQCIMRPQHLTAVLLASLLKDIAQYPMAYDLTEVSSQFAHERFTEQLLSRRHPQAEWSIAELIRMDWGVEVQDVLRVIAPSVDGPFRFRLLHSLISGPIDCDKLDYLKRDATHVGVTFGEAIDEQRLLRHLTVVHDVNRPTQGEYIAALGLSEKALSVAETIIRVRRELFTQVYWHHAVRALRAMLAFVVRRILDRVPARKEDAFWAEFRGLVFDEGEAQSGRRAGGSRLRNPFLLPSSGDDGRSLAATDAAILLFLEKYADATGRDVLRAIRTRQLYKRLAVLAFDHSPVVFNKVYKPFWAYRLHDQHREIEDQRRLWEGRLLARAHRNRAGQDLGPVDETTTGHKDGPPIILVDIPLKASANPRDQPTLWYVPERVVGVYGRDGSAENVVAPAGVTLEDENFDRLAGKIRVFCHPQYISDLSAVLSEAEISEILSG